MILYIGNKLAGNGSTPTMIDSMGELLSSDLKMICVSDKKNKILRLYEMLISICKYRRASFILIDTYSTTNFYYALLSGLLARLLRIRYIPILHGGNLPNRLKNSPYISKQLFSHAYVNIAPSTYLLNIFNENGFNTKHIPNYIHLENYSFKLRKKLTPKILYVRSFSELYNPEMAIHTLQELLTKYPEAELCMVGPDRDGTLDKIKSLCKIMGLENKVIFTGKLSKSTWHKLSEKYDFFINTTKVDNTPVSVIEAMALGLPVISTRVGGIPYLIQDEMDGLLVNPGDSHAMVEKIDYLISSDVVSSSLTLNAREKVKKFDWEVVRKQWLRLLDENR